MASDINDLTINQFVTFQSKSSSDPNTYYGKVLSLMTWEEAIKYGDIAAYNNNLQNQLGSDVYPYTFKEITYFLLERYSYADNQPLDKIIFAKEWIDEATFTIDDNFKKASILIYGVTEDNVPNIIDALKNLGYVAVLTKLE